MSMLRLQVLVSSLRQLPLYFPIYRLVLTDFLVPGFHRKSADWKQIRFRFLIRQHERARARISFPFPLFPFSNNVLIHLRQAMEYFLKITNSIISKCSCPTISATPITVMGSISTFKAMGFYLWLVYVKWRWPMGKNKVMGFFNFWDKLPYKVHK